MSVDQMRNEVRKAYPGQKWYDKVSKMSDAQIIAVYHSFLHAKKFNKKGVVSY